ncbi:ATP-binding cassette domain-containing protein [Salinimonas sp. HHU 13199]|uniref:ATP-binding cassette domain-containing protein n=1 Tax=Salinimonas profundi TaxID=2729140 RepID=A0ABR8LKU1_9ALTE|nr:ATP-binding cassette domain-containing protein [Salinimonas profundi]MBD3585566.1 ATP-binding cassette domain-containing protein [Salinimonas profundi]
MMRQDPLKQWLHQEVGSETLPKLTPLIVIGVCRELALIAAFGAFAAIAQQWVIDSQPASLSLLMALCAALSVSWLCQGVDMRLSNASRFRQLTALEARLSAQFAARQHALVRTRPVYHWQVVWQKHLPALVNWRTDYCVQQYIAIIVPLIVLTVITYLNYFIGLMLLITLPVVPLFMVIVGKGAASLQKREFTALTRLGNIFTDRLMALPLLSTLGAHQRQQQHMEQASQALNTRTMKVVSVAFLSTTVLDFFSTLTVALIAVFIGFSLLGELQVGPEISFFSGLWILLSAPLLLSQLKKLGQFYHQKAQAATASEALTGLLNEPPAAPGTIRTFTGFYARNFTLDAPSLRAFELSVAPGDWIQVSGASGAGKTALLESLAGFRQASHTLGCYCVTLSQQPVFLPGTLRENLCLGARYTQEQLNSVLQDVEMLCDIYALPDGLDTKMGDQPGLSGGQLQRLALARLLLREADVWLLDEPTAHLPVSQHKALCELIHRCCSHKTVIWVSHKPLEQTWFSTHWEVADHQVKQHRGDSA